MIFTKAQIVKYGIENSITYVHDQSNDSNDYNRNSIRNTITPEIIKIFPEFITNANHSITHLDKSFDLMQELIDRHEIVQEDKSKGYIIVSLDKVKSFNNKTSLLYQIIMKYGFNHSTAQDIIETTATGTQFYSQQYEGLYDRGRLLIRLKKENLETDIQIDKLGDFLLPNGNKLLVNMNSSIQLASHLWIDVNKATWPIQVRNVRPGDKFKPHGMNGATKSLKKLCSDLKINRFDKENMLVVCKDDNIVQIIGIRTSHEYITDDIKYALTFSIVR